MRLKLHTQSENQKRHVIYAILDRKMILIIFFAIQPLKTQTDWIFYCLINFPEPISSPFSSNNDHA
jgi:hypothetical protein